MGSHYTTNPGAITPPTREQFHHQPGRNFTTSPGEISSPTRGDSGPVRHGGSFGVLDFLSDFETRMSKAKKKVHSADHKGRFLCHFLYFFENMSKKMLARFGHNFLERCPPGLIPSPIDRAHCEESFYTILGSWGCVLTLQKPKFRFLPSK